MRQLSESLPFGKACAFKKSSNVIESRNIDVGTAFN